MAEEEKQEVADTPLTCKRCGRPHLDKDIEVEEETLKEYIRCTLGGRLFSKTFNVLNNELQVVLTALPAEFEVELERLPYDAGANMSPLDMRLLLTLAEIKVFDPDTSGMKTVYSADLDQRKAMLKNPAEALEMLATKVDSVLLGVLRRMSATFVVLQNAILEEIVNSDFYKGVGLV